ncbi:MAG: hypothetical protein K9M81_02795, partial [Chthoniobacterales bacterium]|nr:hypothetical protein [Chthoniobacterales bacterium]
MRYSYTDSTPSPGSLHNAINREIKKLTRIFHTKSITACGKLIITALVSNCDLGGMYSYSPASQSFARLVL